MDVDDYWSIDSFLAGEEKVKTLIQCEVSDYGFMISEVKEDIEENEKIQMPLWIAKELYANEKVDLAVPKFFSQSYRNILLAGPTVSNIKEKTDYFYEIAFMLASVLKDEIRKSIMPVI